MKLSVAILLFLIISLAQSISQYDFNSCRITNCNAEQINCLSDQSECLNYFSIMRTCFSTCGNSKNWNSCWSSCKNTAARSNSYYLSMSLCYENICYLSQKWIFVFMSLMLLMFLF